MTPCRCGFGARWVLDQEPEGSVLAVAPPKVWCRCANCGERRALLYYEDPKLRAKLATAVELINDARAVMFDLQVRADLERADRAADAWCERAQAFVDGEPGVTPPQVAPAVHVRHEQLSAQIAFLREHFRNDGAEGETVWAVAEAAEKLAARVEGDIVAPEKSDKTFAEVYSEEVKKALNEENERLRDRIEALEGGVVAENARVVREHNELRAKLAAVTEAREASETTFARFVSEVVEALGEDPQNATSSTLTLDRIRSLRVEVSELDHALRVLFRGYVERTDESDLTSYLMTDVAVALASELLDRRSR